jgi:two-component system cell cycle response regulator
MALRVLLADESVTINKVLQLALQDFAVEVSTVNVGVDVLPIALKTRPDIIFVDVLLQKKAGYEVAKELKMNAEMKNVPVVLMWSGFMELDPQKYKDSMADGHLEKPFDSQKLRLLVQSLVPKTKSQQLSQFLKLPPLPEWTLDEEKAESEPPLQLDSGGSPAPQVTNMEPQEPPLTMDAIDTAAEIEGANHEPQWRMDQFQEPDFSKALDDTPESDEFLPVKLSTPPPKSKPEGTQTGKLDLDQEEDKDWVRKPVGGLSLNDRIQSEIQKAIKATLQNEKPPLPEKTTQPMSEITKTNFTATGLRSPVFELDDTASELELDQDLELDAEPTLIGKKPAPAQTKAPPSAQNLRPDPSSLSADHLEKIIRAQAAEIIEKVVWQVVPELAARAVEKEIARLLKEQDERK